MNYEIVCMDEKDVVSGDWTMEQIYHYCNSSYGCGGYGYDLKLPSGKGIAVLGYGDDDYKNRTLDEYVTFVEKDMQKIELKGNTLYDYDEIVEAFIENDNEYDQVLELFSKDKGLYTPEEKEAYIRDIYNKINSEEGFPVCFTLNERELEPNEIFSKIDPDVISKAMLKTKFFNEGDPENAQIFLLANYKPGNGRTHYKINTFAVVEENGNSEILKIKDGIILSKEQLDIVPGEDIPLIIKEMTKAQISEISDEKFTTNFKSSEIFDAYSAMRFGQEEVKKIKDTFKKLKINTGFYELLDERIVLWLSKNEKEETFTSTYKIAHSSYAELRSDLYFCTKKMDLEEKDFSKTLSEFEKFLNKRCDFESEYKVSGKITTNEEFNKIYKTAHVEKKEENKQKIR